MALNNKTSLTSEDVYVPTEEGRGECWVSSPHSYHIQSRMCRQCERKDAPFTKALQKLQGWALSQTQDKALRTTLAKASI
jgi:hypothetical protein